MNPMGGSNNSSRNTASPMPTGLNTGMNSGSMRNMPPQPGMGQGNFTPMGGGMNPMGGGMGSMNPMTRGMGGGPMGQPPSNRGHDPFDNLGSGFGNNQQSQYNRGGGKRY